MTKTFCYSPELTKKVNKIRPKTSTGGGFRTQSYARSRQHKRVMTTSQQDPLLKQVNKEINHPLTKKLENTLLSLQSSCLPRNIASHQSYDSKVINFISNLGIPVGGDS